MAEEQAVVLYTKRSRKGELFGVGIFLTLKEQILISILHVLDNETTGHTGFVLGGVMNKIGTF